MSAPAFWVYMLASARNGTLYVGRTENLTQRITGHKAGQSGSFTQRYKVTMLVYYEVHTDFAVARQREQTLKKWRRAWKLALIETMNPGWHDLAASLNPQSGTELPGLEPESSQRRPWPAPL